MKKITGLLLSLILVFCLAACSGGQGKDDMAEQPTGPANEAAAGEDASASPSDAETSGEEQDSTSVSDTAGTAGKTLVVYYSASGNTKEVAEYIAEAAGADLFELEPAEPYTDADLDWTDDNSRVSREHENEDERVVELTAETAPDWESYDTVFIGFPIWWGIAAWPVDGFIKANDFTGKTVIPFCTSASSGLGESGELLKEAAGTGDWQEGERFRSGASKEDVESWVNGLGLTAQKEQPEQTGQTE